MASAVGYWLTPPAAPASQATVPRLRNPVQVTSAVGSEHGITWSPDGTMLAYESHQSGNWDIWMAQLGGFSPVNRTAEHVGEDRVPAWSADGRQMAFLSDRDAPGDVYVMSPLGGVPRKVGSFGGQARFFSRDPSLQWLGGGRELVARVNPEGPEVVAEILTVSTGERRQVALPGHDRSRIDLRWSPDERYAAYVDAYTWNYQVKQLMLLATANGTATALSDGMTEDGSPSWSPDSRTVYFVSNRGGSKDLWQQRISEAGTAEGEPERVSVGIGMSEAIVSPDGTKLAYVRGGMVGNVWRIPILDDRRATWADAEQLTFDEAAVHGMDVSPDGTRLVVSSERSGNADLWVMPSAGGEMRQLTTHPTPDWGARWSPDGEQVAFYAYRSAERDIWVMPADGGMARQLTTQGSHGLPSWSPDGAEIAFRSTRDGVPDLWVMSVESGDERKLVEGPVSYPNWSPDGQWVVFRQGGGMWRILATGGEPELIAIVSGADWLLSRNGQEIYFYRDGQYWALSVDTRSERQLTDLTGKFGEGRIGEMSADDRYLYFAWYGRQGDIWVMDVEWDEE